MTAFADAASLDRFTLSAGDPMVLLKGTRLDEVAKAELDGIALTPSTLSRVEDHDQLLLKASSSTARLDPDRHYVAHVELKDGRKLRAPVSVDPPRPQATLMNKGIQENSSAAPSPVQLGSADDLPLDGRLVFFLKSTVPAKFPRNEKVELAASDGSFGTQLSLADGSLILADAKTAMGSVEPLSRFGPSAFGPVRLRVLSADGATGDWMPLGTLVRLPGFKELRCPRAIAKAVHPHWNQPVPRRLHRRNAGFRIPHRSAAELYGDPTERSASGQRSAVSQAARRPSHRADSHPAHNADNAGRVEGSRCAIADQLPATQPAASGSNRTCKSACRCRFTCRCACHKPGRAGRHSNP